jgi:hypothetical protein
MQPAPGASREPKRSWWSGWPLRVLGIVVILAAGATAVVLVYEHYRPQASSPHAGSNQTLHPNNSASHAGYLSADSSGVMYVQWTRSGDTISGSLTQSSLQSGKIKAQNDAFTGTISGSGVTLVFGQGSGVNTNITGTFSSSQLSLSFPQTDGSMSQVDLAAASLSDYNLAVGVLQNEQAIEQAARTLKKDYSTLSGIPDALKADEGTLANDLQVLQKDVNTTHADEQKALADHLKYPGGDNGWVSQEAAFVVADVQQGGVNYDMGQIKNDVSAANNDLATAQSWIDAVKGDIATLKSAEAQQPDYLPSAAAAAGLTAAPVRTAISSLQQAVTSDVNQATQLKALALSYMNAVKGLQ